MGSNTAPKWGIARNVNPKGQTTGFTISKCVYSLALGKMIEVAVLEVYEAFNGFYIQYVPTAVTRGMGDGVDQVFDKDDNAISPGTPEFWDALIDDIVGNVPEVLEAYFDIKES